MQLMSQYFSHQYSTSDTFPILPQVSAILLLSYHQNDISPNFFLGNNQCFTITLKGWFDVS